ncbi:MAG: hypothetical protein J3Q66DRAFT_375063 [Benniella sp.]|nr:MAG: hypothetical protein J3Q66DRAFT_375063 [Benniella sp.]
MNLVYSLLVLLSVVAILVQGQPDVVSSRAIFTGVDNSDRDASGFDTFLHSKNHASAVASIIVDLSKQTNFRPMEHAYKETYDQYLEFKEAFTTFEDFLPKGCKRQPLKLTGERDQLKKQIADNYVSPSGDSDVAASAFVLQIPQIENSNLSGTWRLVLITVHGDEDYKISLDFAWIDVKLSIKPPGFVTIEPQDTRLYQTTFEADALAFTVKAEYYAEKYPKFRVVNFLQDLSTPSTDAWLSGSGHACETKPQPPKYAHRRQTLYPLSQLRMDY